MNKILLDQTIIVKALYILTEVFSKPNDFITKEMWERIPELKEQEMKEGQIKIYDDERTYYKEYLFFFSLSFCLMRSSTNRCKEGESATYDLS